MLFISVCSQFSVFSFFGLLLSERDVCGSHGADGMLLTVFFFGPQTKKKKRKKNQLTLWSFLVVHPPNR
jgi:hypothetical protein